MTLIDDTVLDDLFMVHPIAEPTPPEPDDLFTSHTRACVVCGSTFQTCGRGKRCSRCLVGPGGAASDARITCRVCEAVVSVPIDHPALLCPNCLEGLDQTRARVADWRNKALVWLEDNETHWQATIQCSAAFDRWPAIQGALIAVAEKRATPAALNQTWQKRKAEGGALAQLLTAYEGYARESDRISEELERLHRAQTEINTAYIATEI